MSKKDTTYSDAMNEWAAKQSFIRNRRNRILHPNPESPVPLQVLGYLFRLAVVAFICWLVFSKLTSKYYNGEGFNDEFQEKVAALLKADQFESANLLWQGKKAVCKKLTATGADEAFFRNFEAYRIAFELPLLKRLRPSWEIGVLQIEDLAIEFKSGGKSQGRSAAAAAGVPMIAAGLLPSPDLEKLTISLISCREADFRWGLSRATLGALEGTSFDLFGLGSDWRMDLDGGTLRQNWINGLEVDSITVARKGDRIVLSESKVRLGQGAPVGTLEGDITLERLPRLDLQLRLPEVHTRDLLPPDTNIPDLVDAKLKLSLDLSGSINTLSGVETSGTATLLSGTLSKIPVFEAIDNLFKTNSYRIFSPDDGEFEFSTADGKLRVDKFTCRSRKSASILRGEFTYTPAITSRQADAANAAAIGPDRLQARKDDISGKLQLGIRPTMIENNAVAQSFFTDRAEGYVWIDIPLEGPLKDATRKQQGEIAAALREE